MKKHLIILLMLALAMPFVQGQKGCGGAIQFGDEEGVEAQVSEAEPYDDTMAGGHSFVPPGPVGILIPSQTPDVGEGEGGDSSGDDLPDCGAYMPDGSSVAFSIDASMLEQLSMDASVMQLYEPMIQNALDKLNLNLDAKVFVSLADNACFSCEMPPIGAAPVAMWKPASCVSMLGINVFKAGFDLKANFKTPVEADENLIFKLSDSLFAAQIASNIVAFGSKDLVAKAKLSAHAQSNLFMSQKKLFEPALLFFSAKAALAESLLMNRTFSPFRALPQLSAYFNSVDSKNLTCAGALAFMTPAISAAAFDGEKVVMSAALANMEYDEFVMFIQSYAEARDSLNLRSETQQLKESAGQELMQNTGEARAVPAQSDALMKNESEKREFVQPAEQYDINRNAQ
ncbi:MAG: hypothetical protein JXA24_05490 [Proteobacteria bacterium]|nr:hypothetical protein [Pseudomonadota bacterium]